VKSLNFQLDLGFLQEGIMALDKFWYIYFTFFCGLSFFITALVVAQKKSLNHAKEKKVGL
jgi:hypothetical protein